MVFPTTSVTFSGGPETVGLSLCLEPGHRVAGVEEARERLVQK